MLRECELTFAGLIALEPRVIEIRFIFITTVLEPSTTPSTTTEFAGTFEGAALRTYETVCCYAGRCPGR